MKKNIYLVGLFLLSAPCWVMADRTSQSNYLLPNWYYGAGIGLGYYDNGGNSQAYDDKRDNLAGTVYLGYQITPYFASELGYQFLGEAEANYEQGDITGHFEQIVLMARLGYPVTAAFYPYAKIGGAAWFGESNGLRPASDQGFSPAVGVGFEYVFTPRLLGRIEYQYTDELGDESLGYTNHHLTTVGLTWRFGFSSSATPIATLSKSDAVAPIVPVVEAKPVTQPTEPRQFVYSEQKTQSKHSSNLFAHNSSVLANRDTLKDSLAFLQQHPSATAIITGYTDSSGSEQYNLWLSERRAKSVAIYLSSQGIDAARLTAIGKGELMPIADNATEDGRAMNRRVEITISTVAQSETN